MENEIKKPTDEKLKMLADVNERIQELDELQEVEDMIQNNSIIWDVEGKSYRVKKPGRRERQEVKTLKNKKKTELIYEVNIVSEEELIQAYLRKESPIDIPKMRDQILDLQRKIESLAIRLIESQIDSEKKKYEVEIESLQQEQTKISYDIRDLLDCSLEKQLKDFVQEYLICMCFEIKVDDVWQRYYKSYDDFMNSNDNNEDRLISQATWYFSVLINRDTDE